MAAIAAVLRAQLEARKSKKQKRKRIMNTARKPFFQPDKFQWDRNLSGELNEVDEEDEAPGAANNQNFETENEIFFGTIRSDLVGIQYYKGTVSNHEMVSLIREPHNKYDRNAVKAENMELEQVGHIKREDAKVLAQLLDGNLCRIEGVIPYGAANKFRMPVDVHLWGKPEKQVQVLSMLKLQGLSADCSASAERKASSLIGGASFLEEGSSSQSLGTVPDYDHVVTSRTFITPQEMQTEMNKIFETLDEGDKTTEANATQAVKTEMYPHQKQALNWMLCKENKDTLPPFWEKVGEYFRNTLMRFMTSKRPTSVHGGILADDMGLGKTLEMISLILTNDTSGKALIHPLPGTCRAPFGSYEKMSYKAPSSTHCKKNTQSPITNLSESPTKKMESPRFIINPVLRKSASTSATGSRSSAATSASVPKLASASSLPAKLQRPQTYNVNASSSSIAMLMKDDPEFVPDTVTGQLLASSGRVQRSRRAAQRPKRYRDSDDDEEEEEPAPKQARQRKGKGPGKKTKIKSETEFTEKTKIKSETEITETLTVQGSTAAAHDLKTSSIQSKTAAGSDVIVIDDDEEESSESQQSFIRPDPSSLPLQNQFLLSNSADNDNNNGSRAIIKNDTTIISRSNNSDSSSNNSDNSSNNGSNLNTSNSCSVSSNNDNSSSNSNIIFGNTASRTNSTSTSTMASAASGPCVTKTDFDFPILVDSDDDLPDLTSPTPVASSSKETAPVADLPAGYNLKTGRSLSIGPRATLIICPLSVISNWVDQFDEHVRPDVHLQLHVYYGPKRTKDIGFLKDQDVVITTYSTLSADFKEKKSPLHRVEWLRIVLDEGHMIRNPAARQSKAIYELTSCRKWVLTGTPIQNSLKDFWSLLNFLQVKPFTDKKWWNRTIARPVARGDKLSLKRVSHLMRNLAMRRTKTQQLNGQPLIALPARHVYLEKITMSQEERDVYEAMQEGGRVIIGKYFKQGTLLHHYAQVLAILLRLRQLCCHPLLLRKAIAQKALTDPGAVFEDLVPGGAGNGEENHTAINEEEKQRLIDQLMTVLNTGSAEECSICLENLRQAVITTCAHVFCRPCIEPVIDLGQPCPMCRGLLDKNKLIEVPAERQVPDTQDEDTEQTAGDGEWQSSAKIDALMKSLNELRKKDPTQKSVVISQFTSLLKLLETPLSLQGFSFTKLDGTMTKTQREWSVRDFADPSPQSPSIFLLSLKAGGVGINLTAACNVFLMDPAWNPATEDQCFDRCHRLGQTRDVVITRFVMENSVEERMLELQEKKRQIMQAAFCQKPTEEERRANRVNEIRTLMNI